MRRMTCLRILSSCALAALLLFTPCRAQPPRSLGDAEAGPFPASAPASNESARRRFVLANGEILSSKVLSLAEGTMRVRSSGEAAQKDSYASGDWLRWGCPVEPPPRPRVYLSESTWLVTKNDWAGKVPIRIVGDRVTLENELLGKLSIQRRHAECLLFAAAKEPSVARRLLAEAREPSPDVDRVWLVEGDLLRGQILGFDGTRLEVRLDDSIVPILASRIAAIGFARSVDLQPKSPKPAFLVGLSDGSLIDAETLSVGPDQLKLTTPLGLQWESPSKNSLRFVQSLTPEIVYLSDLQPVEYRHTPYFQTSWNLARDRNLRGSPLTVAGHRYAKGLAMHSAARAVYRVPHGAEQFCAELAIDDSAKGRGSVVFRVYAFGAEQQGQLTSLYQSPIVRGGEKPRTVRVDLADVSAVVLVVDYADFGDERDHADWLDARFVP